MRSGPVEFGIAPVVDLLALWTPLTKRSSLVPLYVMARCVHAFAGSAVGPVAFFWLPLVTIVAIGLPPEDA